MSSADWELIEIARVQAMSSRLLTLALERADAMGCTEPNTRSAYALGWLATHAADKIVRLENARPVHGAQPAAGSSSAQSPQPSGGPPNLRVVYVPRESRK